MTYTRKKALLHLAKYASTMAYLEKSNQPDLFRKLARELKAMANKPAK